jgi:hypothetical protein
VGNLYLNPDSPQVYCAAANILFTDLRDREEFCLRSNFCEYNVESRQYDNEKTSVADTCYTKCDLASFFSGNGFLLNSLIATCLPEVCNTIQLSDGLDCSNKGLVG